MNLRNQFIRYVSQNIFGMIGVSCYIIADTFFISKAAGANGITVLNLALPIYGLIFAIGSMIGVGSATKYTILKAQGDKSADSYLANAVIFILLISIPFVISGLLFPHRVLKLMGGDSLIIKTGIDYVRIFLTFTPFFMLNYVVSAYVRNDNAPGRAMIGTMSGSFFNIIFDYIFMFPLGMGLKGAALATGISPLVSILISGTHFFEKRNTIRFKLVFPSVKRLFMSCQLGISAFVAEMSSAVITTVFNFLLLGLVGNIGVAAYGVIANYALIAVAIFNGVSQGMQPLLSRAYGDGDERSVNKLLQYGIVTAFLLAIALIAFVFATTDTMVLLFNSEKSVELAGYAHKGIRLYFLGYLFAGFNIVGTGFFGACECSKEAFVSSISRGFIAIILFALVLSVVIGVAGVWLSFLASELLTFFIIVIGLILRKRRMIKN